MKLYLVQHGQSKSEQEDPERGLTDGGAADVKKVAGFAAEKVKLRVSKIFHSGKTRARQTAELMAEPINPAGGVEKSDGLAPLDDPSTWSKRLTGEKNDLMLVGHLPHMSKLAALLTCKDAEKTVVGFKNAGIVCLERDDEGSWRLSWIVVPEIL